MSDNLQEIFDAAYYASLDPAVAGLLSIQDFSARETDAATLAAQGKVVDVPINVWGWDPYLVMKNRQAYGFTWVPSALQPNIAIAPGVSQPGTVPYDPNNPPAGSIRVSTNPADFPPFNPPPVVPLPTPNSDPVGIQSLGTLYLSTPGETFPDGAKFTDARGTFVKHVTFTPFGRTNYWEKIA